MIKNIKSPVQERNAKQEPPSSDAATQQKQPVLPPEFGGRKGPEATRFGDWEMNGKCVDF